MRRTAHASAMAVVGAVAVLGTACSGPTREDKAAATAPAPVQQTVEQLEAAVRENPLKEAYFGETHVHTSYSLDAYIGGAQFRPADAYRFAKGEKVTINGQLHDIRKPLDFCAVTDHAEYIGEMYTTQVKGAPGYDEPMTTELRGLETFEERERWYMDVFQKNQRSGKPGQMPFYAGPETAKSAWKDVIAKAAQDNYEPGRFTTIIAYEWTSVFKGGNMHRNVLFRDTKVPDAPLSAIDTADEEKLWDWMAQQEAQGSKLFAIPHNSNGSKGFMFEPTDNAGNPLSKDYAERRAKWEPLIEMMQIKGNSEVVAKLWSTDEFADFENAESMQKYNERTFKKENFVRWAVIGGLAWEKKIGANPWKLGFAGGTDNHNGLPGDVVEDNVVGTHGGYDDTAQKPAEERTQDPLFVVESHLTHNLTSKFWVGGDLRYQVGGETTTDGRPDDNSANHAGGGFSVGYQILRPLAVIGGCGKIFAEATA